MRTPWIALAILAAAAAPAAADRPLELQEKHRAGQAPPELLELAKWDCTQTSAKTVTVKGRVKNISGNYTMRSWSAYIEVLDMDGGVLGKSGKPLKKDLRPEGISSFHGQITFQGGIPVSCRIDFGDEDEDYKVWRASTSH